MYFIVYIFMTWIAIMGLGYIHYEVLSDGVIARNVKKLISLLVVILVVLVFPGFREADGGFTCIGYELLMKLIHWSFGVEDDL
jgi:uncharacterized membrane protein